MAEDLFSSPTPFTPPTTEEDRLAWLRLIRSHRVGTRTFFRLLHEHVTAQAALEALPEVARAAGVERYSPASRSAAEAEYAAGTSAGAVLLCHGERDYPAALGEIEDPPPVLWCLGDPAYLHRPMVALVGARNASSLGTRMARSLAAGLGEAGYTVVSGLARGIDAAAHHAAIGTGTVAVHAGGADVVYPLENLGLAESIAAQGARLSEQPMGLNPQARHFPRRNRIISGLARGVVVVEAAARSGSLITAREALDQGREVLAVPGHPFDARASGANALIRDGATLVRGVEDALSVLRRPTPPGSEDTVRTAASIRRESAEPPPTTDPTPSPRRAPADIAALHSAILDRLGPSPVAEDQLIRDLALPAAQLSPELLALELDGRIARQPGGLLARVD